MDAHLSDLTKELKRFDFLPLAFFPPKENYDDETIAARYDVVLIAMVSSFIRRIMSMVAKYHSNWYSQYCFVFAT